MVRLAGRVNSEVIGSIRNTERMMFCIGKGQSSIPSVSVGKIHSSSLTFRFNSTNTPMRRSCLFAYIIHGPRLYPSYSSYSSLLRVNRIHTATTPTLAIAHTLEQATRRKRGN